MKRKKQKERGGRNKGLKRRDRKIKENPRITFSVPYHRDVYRTMINK